MPGLIQCCFYRSDVAYAKYETDRILTAATLRVNTRNWPVTPLAALILLGRAKFKQTFVLDRSSGVDIMLDHPFGLVVCRALHYSQPGATSLASHT